MPIIVAGMPAAGTALVVACLRACGVRLVDACGMPQAAAPADTVAEPWGWVDAEGSLALSVRLARQPTAKVVVCLRNPLEVAVSLCDRHGVGLASGLALWKSHADAILASTSAAHRVVAHYDAFRRDPAAAAARLARALGLAEPVDAAACRRAWRAGDTPRFTLHDLGDCGLDAATLAAYRQLCGEAGHEDAGDREPRLDRGLLHRLAAACRERQPAPRQAASGLEQTIAALQADVAGLRAELASRDDDFQELLDELRDDIEEEILAPAKLAYRRTIRDVRRLLKDHVPPNAVVAVLSKGDEQLVRQRCCTAWHFPRDPRGGYLGYHPAGDLAAIANLEMTRAAGATHLLLPETHRWWLTSYPGFHGHLQQHARLVESRPGVGMLFDLAADGARPDPPGRRLAEALGRRPHVLAWQAPGAAAAFPGGQIFEPPTSGRILPYIDRSIDVVAVAAPDADQLAEARRVARVAVVDVTDPRIDWIERPVVREPPSVSIVMPVHGGWPLTAACLRALLRSLPAGWPVEVIVVDDASPDETPARLASAAEADRRLVVVSNDFNLGFVGSANRGASVATGDYLVFLNNDTVPLPGWLPPLIRTFDEFPRAGAVGGKLLFPDGRLQEAGGIIFADASACHFGREHPDPSASVFSHVRRVDYVSAALMATPRDLFAALGGFDPAFAPGYYEDTDYCFRLREAGREVLFQPAATIVHLEGGTAGGDHAVGMKRHQEINRRRFQARHAAALMRHGARPPVVDRDSWPSLAHRTAAEAP